MVSWNRLGRVSGPALSRIDLEGRYWLFGIEKDVERGIPPIPDFDV